MSSHSTHKLDHVSARSSSVLMKTRAAFDVETSALESVETHTDLMSLSSGLILQTYATLCLLPVWRNNILMPQNTDLQNNWNKDWKTNRPLHSETFMTNKSTFTEQVFIIYALPVLTIAASASSFFQKLFILSEASCFFPDWFTKQCRSVFNMHVI